MLGLVPPHTIYTGDTETSVDIMGLIDLVLQINSIRKRITFAIANSLGVNDRRNGLLRQVRRNHAMKSM